MFILCSVDDIDTLLKINDISLPSYRTASGSGNYIGIGSRIETGTEEETTIIIVDIFDTIQTVCMYVWSSHIAEHGSTG